MLIDSKPKAGTRNIRTRGNSYHSNVNVFDRQGSIRILIAIIFHLVIILLLRHVLDKKVYPFEVL